MSSAIPASPFSSIRNSGFSCDVDEFDGSHIPRRDRWLHLFERSPVSRISHHPDYAAAVFPEVGQPGWTITCLQNDEPVGMAILIPKMCRMGRQLLPGASKSLLGVRLAGFGLLLRQDDKYVADELVSKMASELSRRRIPCIEFEELMEDSHLWDSLQSLTDQGFQTAPDHPFDTHYRIRLSGTAEDFWGGFKSKHRYRMRKEREGLPSYRVKCYRNVGEVDEWLSLAHQISRNSWQSHQLGLRIRNDDEACRFLTFLATMGALRSYLLFSDETPVSFVMSHQWNGTFHYDEVGFDRRFANQFPGKVLLQEIINDLFDHDPPQTFDFGLGEADYKRFYSNDQTRSATLALFPPGIRSRYQLASMRLHRNLNRTARGALERTGWYDTLRRKLRDMAKRSPT